jgi:hypothetical protein
VKNTVVATIEKHIKCVEIAWSKSTCFYGISWMHPAIMVVRVPPFLRRKLAELD